MWSGNGLWNMGLRSRAGRRTLWPIVESSAGGSNPPTARVLGWDQVPRKGPKHLPAPADSSSAQQGHTIRSPAAVMRLMGTEASTVASTPLVSGRDTGGSRPAADTGHSVRGELLLSSPKSVDGLDHPVRSIRATSSRDRREGRRDKGSVDPREMSRVLAGSRWTPGDLAQQIPFQGEDVAPVPK